jgi:propanol-preferring alcohol dehydrogenase
MRAMLLNHIARFTDNRNPLELTTLPDPVPGEQDILIRVSACGVCHTELDEIEGRIAHLNLPLVLGHQIVGTVMTSGNKAKKFSEGERVGIGWIYQACGSCSFCREGRENLCTNFRATGCDVYGGYAEYIKVPEAFAFPIPVAFSDSEAAPLLCAGAIGYRSLRLAGLRKGMNLGFTGFGASAHIALQMAKYLYPQNRIFVFARSEQERRFSEELGADWAGDTDANAPEKLDCIIDTTPAWKPVIHALENLGRGGRLVINAIRKEEKDKNHLLTMEYQHHLWQEKEIKTVANVTRADIRECLELAAKMRLHPEFQEFPFEDANQALLELKERHIRGAKVLRIAK